jgi:hypothetical protein
MRRYKTLPRAIPLVGEVLRQIQPEYTFALWIVGPIVDLAKKGQLECLDASEVVFVGVGVECGAFCSAEIGR